LLGWAGLSYLFTGMVVAMLVALPVALWTLWRERKFTVNIAFGPPLMIGTLAVVLLHA
jgi:prepilin signal peptidase PulO-like enzyme (type II secretory pathway)